MTTFKYILAFFNSKNSNKLFTRAEYILWMRNMARGHRQSYLDTVRCYLVRAGYLNDEEPGVYRKLKKIPDGITLTKLQDEAYPQSKSRRTELRRLDRWHQENFK